MITFYMKGADVVMGAIVQYNDWLEEEVCSNSVINVWLLRLGAVSYIRKTTAHWTNHENRFLVFRFSANMEEYEDAVG